MAEGQEHLQTDEDLEAILRLAVRRSPFDDDLRSRLRQTADELGITPEQLAAAEAEYALNKKREEEAAAERQAFEADFASFRKSRWASFYQYLVKFVSINVFLHIINFLSNGWSVTHKYWAIWVLLAWGIGLAGRFSRVAFASREDEERKFQKWRIKNGVLARVEQFVTPKNRHD